MVRPFRRILASWLLLISPMVACSLTIPTAAPAQPSTENPYRYDELPNRANESAIISDYRSISAWDKNDITYAFANGTDQLEEDLERDLIGRALGLWSEQNPLTFTETADTAYCESYINDIRGTENTDLEVDTCEVWNTDTWRQGDGQFVDGTGPELIPPTISIEQVDGS